MVLIYSHWRVVQHATGTIALLLTHCYGLNNFKIIFSSIALTDSQLQKMSLRLTDWSCPPANDVLSSIWHDSQPDLKLRL